MTVGITPAAFGYDRANHKPTGTIPMEILSRRARQKRQMNLALFLTGDEIGRAHV